MIGHILQDLILDVDCIMHLHQYLRPRTYRNKGSQVYYASTYGSMKVPHSDDNISGILKFGVFFSKRVLCGLIISEDVGQGQPTHLWVSSEVRRGNHQCLMVCYVAELFID